MSLWNFKDPLRRGFISLTGSGVEKFGTVLKSGYMKKTVTVKVSSYHWERKYKLWINKPKRFQVHDEKELGRVGDKVVIRLSHPKSVLKHYYLKSFVWMSPRQNYVVKDFLQFEKEALLYNDKLRNKTPTKTLSFLPGEMV